MREKKTDKASDWCPGVLAARQVDYFYCTAPVKRKGDDETCPSAGAPRWGGGLLTLFILHFANLCVFACECGGAFLRTVVFFSYGTQERWVGREY